MPRNTLHYTGNGVAGCGQENRMSRAEPKAGIGSFGRRQQTPSPPAKRFGKVSAVRSTRGPGGTTILGIS